MLRFLTSGESHGEKEIVVLDGFPAGVIIDIGFINKQLAYRQKGYGRGGRMKIEKDTARIVSGLKNKTSLGSPITVLINNKDFSINKLPKVKAPRPGHADLAGLIKYGFKDARCVLERASARETVSRVALGAICKILLAEFNISALAHTVSIGDVAIKKKKVNIKTIEKIINTSVLRCVDKEAEKLMIKKIDQAKKNKDTLGGVIEVIIDKVPYGLGSYVQYDRRLDAKLAQAIMSIPGIKAVEIGDGVLNSTMPGSEVHDEVFSNKGKGFVRKTNRAGGIEGGVSNGEALIIRGYMKPISSLMRPLNTINIDTKKNTKATKERADVCAVASAGVIAEAMCAFVVADVFLEKFGQDSLADIKASYKAYAKRIKKLKG